MKNRYTALTAAILAAAMLSATACSDKSGEGSSYSSNKKNSFSSSASLPDGEESQPKTEATVIEPNAVPVSGAKPVFSLSNTQGKPGETVEVTASLSGADKKWSMCGIHFAYPQELECVTIPDDPKVPQAVKGGALSDMTAFQPMLWLDNLSPELTANNEYSLFFAAIGTGDTGKDGDIATFSFTIPADAQPGTVYDLRFFFYEGDMFNSVSSDSALLSYAATHWQNGTITVI